MNNGIVSVLCRAVVFNLALIASAGAEDYRARASGDWHKPGIWQPRGVPGLGDRIVGLGRHVVTLSAPAEIGRGEGEPVLVLDGSGTLVVGDGAVLGMHGHLTLTGEGAQLELRADSRIEFSPGPEQTFELQLFAPKQRVLFAGRSGARGELTLARGAQGHWFVASKGHRDALLGGAYGRICDALNPVDNKAWSMYLGNDRTSSRLRARYIEFRNSGQVGVYGLDAGEWTEVDMRGWTFRDSHPAASALPALWFDGYGDVVATPPTSRMRKRINDLVSDKGVYVRYVQDYVLDRWVLGAEGTAGNVRSGNNGGNAREQTNLFLALRDSGGVGLVADVTRTAYLYAEADNPHGFDTRHLRGDALLRNFWFESNYPDQSDTGDAVLTNGPQGWVSEHGGQPVTLTIEHSGSIGDTSAKPVHPVFLTVNEGTGMRFRLRHNFIRQPGGSNAIALDENGETASHTGLEFMHNLVYSPTPVRGNVLGSAAAARVVQPDVFEQIDRNLYFNVSAPAESPDSVHAVTLTRAPDQHSFSGDPRLRAPGRSLKDWDKLLGGPGLARHAIEEMQKLNDDSGYDPRYSVAALVAYVAAGHQPTNPEMLDPQGTPLVGPALNLSRREAAVATDS